MKLSPAPRRIAAFHRSSGVKRKRNTFLKSGVTEYQWKRFRQSTIEGDESRLLSLGVEKKNSKWICFSKNMIK